MWLDILVAWKGAIFKWCQQKFQTFWTPHLPPCHCHNHVTSILFVCFLDTPSPPVQMSFKYHPKCLPHHKCWTQYPLFPTLKFIFCLIPSTPPLPKLPSLNRPFLFSIHIVAGTLHYSATAAASAVEEKLVAFSGNIANEGEGEKCELWLQTKLGSGRKLPIPTHIHCKLCLHLTLLHLFVHNLVYLLISL